MKIGIDARLMHRRGIGRYIQEIINYLPLLDNKNEYIIYRSKEARGILKYPSNCTLNFKESELPGKDFTYYQLKEMGKMVKNDGIDLFHSMYDPLCAYLPVEKKILSVHNPSFEKHIKVFSKSPIRAMLQQHILKSALHKSCVAIASSDVIKERLLKLANVDSKKIAVIYQGIGEEFRTIFNQNEVRLVKEKYGISKEFFFSVGSFSQNRNEIISLLNAYAALPDSIKTRFQLLVSGEHPPKILLKIVEGLGIQKNVKFLGFVSASDLPVLYSTAKIFLYFAPYNGFENPILESMASGTPIISSSKIRLSDTVKNVTLSVNPEDHNEFKAIVKRLTSDNAEYILLRQFGVERAMRYSWKKMVKQTIDLYNALS